MYQALLGFKRKFQHLDGHDVEVDRIDKITRPGLEIVLSGEGMPIHEDPINFGRLRITFAVQFPDYLSPEKKLALKEIL